MRETETEENEEERKAHHCCGRATTAEFAMSRPVVSAGADSRISLTQT